MRYVVLMCLLILTPFALFASPADARFSFTGQHLNGRGWKALTTDVKIGYVLAMSEAPILCDTNSPNNHYIFNDALTRAEVIEAIDAFYEESANAAVLVASAYRYVALSARGASPDELAAELSRIRRVAHALSSK